MDTATRKRVVVFNPGRGTYNRPELGYLQRRHPNQQPLISRFDTLRAADQPSISQLDQMQAFQSKVHLAATNAAPLIYACAYADFLSLDTDEMDIVAVSGNSMGWYIALACAGALDAERGFTLVSEMAALTSGAKLGGQLIYPEVDVNWRQDSTRQSHIQALLTHPDPKLRLQRSICFGGYQVLAGPDTAIQHGIQSLPPADERYPFVLPGHSAFHTSLMQPASERALQRFSPAFFTTPAIPLIDGRGKVWQPLGTDVGRLRDYTLVHQVCETYDFTRAVITAVKEFAPDQIVLTGPGNTMGGAVAQALIQIGWQGIRSKADFIERQAHDPFVISMGMES
ncbi:ACP S-malonyltransferase [Aliidiomarina sanyensis]|uniref:[acyl-carrier-protein] S-malonyltransferase n=1 Tax=Aliidiomarina sanyensis TaxID=1249555 RepID=A0A432WPQ6_9GAMM|nr:ACP S-malonyltransferase [Aliidiomarina sanyensis]RUO35790.1 malonyl CoA-ACP transacylase [Aliidiomarina sanyensis]